ncbi:mucin-2-like [Contarinia nasturtii]|uniref:mucin-2-like n=1 Tax=Contarinia nasturtii TaxID=265458 RepID=UPI0012D47796|nr:mucin-2-like [Contarinia nasturtii]
MSSPEDSTNSTEAKSTTTMSSSEELTKLTTTKRPMPETKILKVKRTNIPTTKRTKGPTTTTKILKVKRTNIPTTKRTKGPTTTTKILKVKRTNIPTTKRTKGPKTTTKILKVKRTNIPITKRTKGPTTTTKILKMPTTTTPTTSKSTPSRNESCTYNNVKYKHGSKIQEYCNLCACDNGQWNCTHKQCTGRCVFWGDHYFKTFDGLIYSYNGQYSSHLLQLGDEIDIISHHIPCSYGVAKVSCLTGITLKANYLGLSTSIDFYNNSKIIIKIDEVDKTSYLPIALLHDRVYLRREDTGVVSATFSDGLKVTWKINELNEISITIDSPTSYIGRTSGLCGMYDGDHSKDLKIPDGAININATVSENSWHYKSTTDICASNPKRMQKAQKACSYLKSDVFVNCSMDSKRYYKTCMHVLCVTYTDEKFNARKDSVYDEYAEECSRKSGKTIHWKDVTCPIGQVFANCSKWSYRSCNDVLSPYTQNFSTSCVASCRCPEGQAFNINGKCVAIKECAEKTCTHNDRQYTLGSKVQKDCNTCKCQKNGQWNCTEIKCPKPDRCKSNSSHKKKVYEACSDLNKTLSNCPVDFEKHFETCLYDLCVADTDEIFNAWKSAINDEYINKCNKSREIQQPYRPKGCTSNPSHKQKVIESCSHFKKNFADCPVDVSKYYVTCLDYLCAAYTDEIFDAWKNVIYDKYKNKCNQSGEAKQRDHCASNSEHNRKALKACFSLKRDIFTHCSVDVSKFYQKCLNDLCAADTDVTFKARKNRAYNEYKNACSRTVKCPAEQIYTDCSKWSYHSCRDVLPPYSKNSKTYCIVGCRCPEGQAFDISNRCVAVKECKSRACTYNNVQYQQGSQIKQDCTSCKCYNSQWTCTKNKCTFRSRFYSTKLNDRNVRANLSLKQSIYKYRTY